MPILTVGETANFLSDGGMIRFHIENDKIRFDINLGDAEASHLKISSRLAASGHIGDSKRRSGSGKVKRCESGTSLYDSTWAFSLSPPAC